jgi:hypothetical protein
MKALKTFTSFASCVALAIMLSCEIEDEYSNPQGQTTVGQKLFASNGYPARIFWSEITNEIISVGPEGLIAFDLESEKQRRLSFGSSAGIGYVWLRDNSIYVLTYGGELSVINLTNFDLTQNIADSVILSPIAAPFHTSRFAYAKMRPTDSIEPSIFLYDLGSRKETYVTSGRPLTFSPDGKQLLFEFQYHLYKYDTETKATTNFEINDIYSILKWTTDGIISFGAQNEYVVVRNESTHVEIGRWKSMFGLMNDSFISSSLKNIIVSDYACSIPNVIGECGPGMRYIHSIVNIEDDTLTTLLFTTPQEFIQQYAISPDEKNFAYVSSDYYVYLTESQ